MLFLMQLPSAVRGLLKTSIQVYKTLKKPSGLQKEKSFDYVSVSYYSLYSIRAFTAS